MRKECAFLGFGVIGDQKGEKERASGVHPRGDEKSAKVIERKTVVTAPSEKRVRKQLEAKELNGVEESKDDARARYGG